MGKKDAIMIIVIAAFIIVVFTGCIENQPRRFGNMKLSSSAFSNNGTIPVDYTCDGADISPPLSFSSVPATTKSLVLIMDDPDALIGTWVHWLVWNIPANTAGFLPGENITFPQGKNDFGTTAYGGPCPPSGVHRYFFKLYVLDTMLSLKAGATKQQLESAMSSHIIEEAQLIGLYGR
jgi:Raf kinase inhibitor-like YbhB/YbcL family protein